MLSTLKTLFSILKTKQPLYLFIDRPQKADDNAEHLYRYMAKKNLRNQQYFILSKSSLDWDRLSQQGFNLIAYGGFFHFILLLKSTHYISSHLPKFEIKLGFIRIPKFLLKYFSHYKFIFLQHGVTHNDISQILNKHKIDLIITAGYPEYKNFIENPKYFLTKEKIALTGFPRFDYLIANKKNENIILIMPTWRAEFTTHSKKRIEFASSQYCIQWRNFLNAPQLKSITSMFNYKIVFIAHPELEPFIEKLHIPPYIQIPDHKNFSIQYFLSISNILITDYSSIAFDMAIQEKSICYFQFDKDKFFTDTHLYKKGYFDYENNGFGEVCYNIETLCISLKKLCQNNGYLSSKYKIRIRKFFPYFDTNNTERVAHKILNL